MRDSKERESAFEAKTPQLLNCIPGRARIIEYCDELKAAGIQAKLQEEKSSRDEYKIIDISRETIEWINWKIY